MENFFIEGPVVLMDEAKMKRVQGLAISFLVIAYYLVIFTNWEFTPAAYFCMFVIGICCYYSKVQIVLRIYMIGLLVLIFVNFSIISWFFWTVVHSLYSIIISDNKREKIRRSLFPSMIMYVYMFIHFTFTLWKHWVELRGVRFA